ncbi:hypothetical protein DS745_20470 [Anaerobacillus alkaliphilus]|uniref:DUF4367 domain-containing protein n=1 Tax=Anaerobacillus alkaliphilus TaxID=1548597 RepID=A0A4Q0VR42_9BACI|nr:hypothetical protein [Anaerobacillus alkaliphilus]RXI98689.1 hypothetical protein DS745_20470 [Anaerobacillus alkaliphilus]
MKSSNEQVTSVLNKMVVTQPQPPQFTKIWNKYQSENETSLFGIKRWQMVLCLACVFILTTGFGYYQLFWANQEIVISSNQEDLSGLVTPLETFENLKAIQGDVITGEQALSVAPWIHIQEEVVGWQKVDSYGSNYTGEMSYFELYVNTAGEKVVVMQSYDEAMTTSLNHVDTDQHTAQFRQGFPEGSVILDGFGTDLAILMDLQAGRHSLIVYKQVDNEVYRIDVWGTGSTEQVIEFGKLYYQAK